MTLYTSVQDSVRNVTLVALNDYPSSPVIFSHLNGAEPSESYVVINVLSIDQVAGHATGTLTNTDKELSIRVPYEVMIQFTFIGSASGDMAHSFNQTLRNNPLVTEELAKNKLGVMRKSQVRRSPQKRDTQWIDNHNIDVTFSYFVNTQQVVEYVEAVQIQDQLSGDTFFVPDTFVPTP